MAFPKAKKDWVMGLVIFALTTYTGVGEYEKRSGSTTTTTTNTTNIVQEHTHRSTENIQAMIDKSITKAQTFHIEKSGRH